MYFKNTDQRNSMMSVKNVYVAQRDFQVQQQVQAQTSSHQDSVEKHSSLQLLQTLSLCGFINR